MTAVPQAPKWPVPMFCTWKPRDYRSELEHARQAKLSAAEAEHIDAELKKVLDEQLGRARPKLLGKVTSEQAARRRACQHATRLEEASWPVTRSTRRTRS